MVGENKIIFSQAKREYEGRPKKKNAYTHDRTHLLCNFISFPFFYL